MYKKAFFLFVCFLASHSPLQEITPAKGIEIGVPAITEAPVKTEDEVTSHSLLFVGDIMLGRYVETLMKRDGLTYPFTNIKSLLFDSTYVIANLEGPIPREHKQTASNGFGFSFQKDIVSVLSNYHISAVSLANNHTSDQGEDGYQNTVDELLGHNIASFGDSPSFKPNTISNTIAGETFTTIGINLITPRWNEEKTLEGVKALCIKHQNETLIAFIHAGTEYTHKQSGKQVEFAHKLLSDTCVQIIIGSHPHVVQGIEKVNGKIVFYSLGNFIFDQYFSEDTQEGLTVKLEKDGANTKFTLIPVTQSLSQVSIADAKTRSKILNDIAEASNEDVKDSIEQGTILLH